MSLFLCWHILICALSARFRRFCCIFLAFAALLVAGNHCKSLEMGWMEDDSFQQLAACHHQPPLTVQNFGSCRHVLVLVKTSFSLAPSAIHGGIGLDHQAGGFFETTPSTVPS